MKDSGGVVGPHTFFALPGRMLIAALSNAQDEGGRTALHSALASCAPGLVTVNIDNGYGAACAVIRALGLHARPGSKAPER